MSTLGPKPFPVVYDTDIGFQYIFESGAIPIPVGTSGITQLTGIVTAGPGSGSQATTINLASAHLIVGNGSNIGTSVALSGDATLSNAGALTLATVNSNVGSFTNANVTVDAKGRVTAASSGGGSSIVATHIANLSVEYNSSSATPVHIVESDLTITANPANTLLVTISGPETIVGGGQMFVYLYIDGVIQSNSFLTAYINFTNTIELTATAFFFVTPPDGSSHVYSLYLSNSNTGTVYFGDPGYFMIQEAAIS